MLRAWQRKPSTSSWWAPVRPGWPRPRRWPARDGPSGCSRPARGSVAGSTPAASRTGRCRSSSAPSSSRARPGRCSPGRRRPTWQCEPRGSGTSCSRRGSWSTAPGHSGRRSPWSHSCTAISRWTRRWMRWSGPDASTRVSGCSPGNTSRATTRPTPPGRAPRPSESWSGPRARSRGIMWRGWRVDTPPFWNPCAVRLRSMRQTRFDSRRS